MAKDILIPISFPDYIVSTPVGNIPELGHAGILFIRRVDGLTKYYEYGRYDPQEIGVVQRQVIPNVSFGTDGKPTQITLQKTLRTISEKTGKRGRISAAYVANGKFDTVLEYADKQMQKNTDSSREEYGILTNNCMHFVKAALEAAGLNLPSMIDPRPNSYIDELRDSFENLDYNYSKDQLIFSP